MRANNVLGLIFSNAYDSALPELTNLRTMGSVPFCGRYRLIDFALSNMVNGGIVKVGVFTKSNYRSLMDHLGTGKPWDLSRKRAGMYILPPFATGGSEMYTNRIETLKSNLQFISRSNEEYVLLCDCNSVFNFDSSAIVTAHIESGADITILSKTGTAPELDDVMTFKTEKDGRISGVLLSQRGVDGVTYSLNSFLLKRSLLERLVNEAASLHYDHFERDIIQRNVASLKIHALEINTFARVIDSLGSYFESNLEMLLPENRRSLFTPENPIYTKVRDDVPAIYGIGSSVKNSLVADGCALKGEVDGCVLSRGVTIEKGAVVKNSIIMQDSFIGAGAHLENVILDKKVIIKPGKSLCGAENFPVFVGKGIVV